MLYRHRDEQEAASFLDRLLEKIKIPRGSRILDLACGRGRHARFLHSRGMNVHGVDLSPSSIVEANLLCVPGLSFELKDMRMPWPKPEFDLALSLFTSFGYFDTDEENRKVLETLRSAIYPSGYVLLDFFNSHKVLNGLLGGEAEQKQIGEFTFCTKKWADEGWVEKEIRVQSSEQEWVFTERVRAYSLPELILLTELEGLEIQKIWGNYELKDFDNAVSDRCILLMNPRQ